MGLRTPVFVPQVEGDIQGWHATYHTADLTLPEWNWCSLCCVRGIALALDCNPPPLEEMYGVAFERWGVFYRDEHGRVIGARHRELAEYIDREFGLIACPSRHQNVADIARFVRHGWYAIASVSPEIRDDCKDPPASTRGHLVTVFRATRRHVVIHNSAGLTPDRQQNVHIPRERFAQVFSGNVIYVYGKLRRDIPEDLRPYIYPPSHARC